MKTKIFLFILTVITGCATSMKDFNYSIDLQIMAKNRWKVYSYKLNKTRIIVTKFSTNDDSQKVLVNRETTPEEQKKLFEFLKNIDIDDLEVNYVNNSVRGERSYMLDLEIDGKFKKITIYYKSDKNIRGIFNVINSLLDNEYKLHVPGT